MATGSVIFRNITNTYFDYRREIKKKKNRFKLSAYEKLDDEEFGKENLLNTTDIEMQDHASLPPFWIEKIEECTEDLSIIKKKLLELEKLQSNKLLNVLNDDEKLSNTISQMSTDITFLIKECEKKIQTIMQEEEEKNHVIEKLKKNAKHSLASQLQTLSQLFHKKQKNYLKEYKKLTTDYEELCGFQDEHENFIPNQNFINEGKHQKLYEQPIHDENAKANIAKRNHDLKRIADTVIDIHTIFKELSVMLVDQGSVLDQIDYNIELTLDKSEEGLRKLKILEKRENDKRAKKCINFLTSLIFVLLILIIIKHLS